MNTIVFLTANLKKQSQKVDKFLTTYLRVFEDYDKKKLMRKNNLGKLVFSLVTGPVPIACSILFPYNLIYTEFYSLPFIYELPVFSLTFFISRELFANISFRNQLRFKQKIYDKYFPQMDLTKEQIEELEYIDNLLKLESSEESSKENSQENSQESFKESFKRNFKQNSKQSPKKR